MSLSEVKRFGSRTVSATAISLILSLALPPLITGAMGQDFDDTQPEMGSLQDYAHDGDDDSTSAVPALGIEVADGATTLDSGTTMRGPLVIQVTPGSPAARAGLESERRTGKMILMGTLIAGSFFFPPAFFGVIAFSQTEIGESHDIIIAVDSQRTRNVRELDSIMKQSSQGPILYVSIIRRGQRRNLQVAMPFESGETE